MRPFAARAGDNRPQGVSIVIRIAEVGAGSIAEELRIEVGTRILRINGQRVRDGLDYAFLSADEQLSLDAVGPDGAPVVYEIRRDPDEALGIAPAPDKVRECANECVFCFIDGNPPGARDPLWLKDDDFRLSFTYGSYVTLTNLGPKGLQRLIDQRLSPLYVSVHATNPRVRRRLLGNDRAGLIMDQLETLLGGGLEVHAQVVLCPGWNDGEELERTQIDLFELGEGVRSLSVVPVGLTRYNLNRPVRLLTKGEAARALASVDVARKTALAERGVGWCYAADELFLLAGKKVPDRLYYDELDLSENGVGALRGFLDDARRIRAKPRPLPGVERICIATAASMAPFAEELAPGLADATEAEVSVRTISNSYFGPTVTIAGLMSGADLLDQLPQPRSGDLFLIPGEALNADRLFIDGVAWGEVERALRPGMARAGRRLSDALPGG